MNIEINPFAGDVLGVTIGIARRSQAYLGSFIKGSVGVFLPPQTNDQRVVQMLRNQPLHEAGLGVDALHRGERLGQPDLMVTGRFIIASSLIKADESRVVPDVVTAEVVDIALEEEIYPDINPYLPVPVLDRTAKVIEKFDPRANVIPLFPHV